MRRYASANTLAAMTLAGQTFLMGPRPFSAMIIAVGDGRQDADFFRAYWPRRHGAAGMPAPVLAVNYRRR